MIEALIGLLGVVVGALMTAAKDIWVDRRSRRKDAEYLAIRVVSMLDRFIEGCAEVAGDDGLSDEQLDEDGERQIQVSEPKFEVQSLDVEWKSISARLMYDILSFPELITAANHRVSGAFEHDCPPDYEEGFEERQFQYTALGLKASKLSNELRSNYSLPKRDYKDWDPIEYLSEQQNRIKENRARKNERRAKMWEPGQAQ